MKVIQGKEKPAQNAERNGLLAKIHIAKKQLGIDDDHYEAVLKRYKVDSAADLTVPQMEAVVKFFKSLGFKPLHARWYKKSKERNKDSQIVALWKRARELAAGLEGGTTRLQGLVRKVCGVEALEWCRDEAKLERLLKILGEIHREGRRLEYADNGRNQLHGRGRKAGR